MHYEQYAKTFKQNRNTLPRLLYFSIITMKINSKATLLLVNE